MTKEEIAKIIFHLAIGRSQWDNPFYADEREGSLNTAEAIAAALAAQQDGVREALEWIAAKPDEDNEWDGTDKFHECRDHARDTLATLKQVPAERDK